MHTNCSVTISQTVPGTIVYPESLTGFINQTTDLLKFVLLVHQHKIFSILWIG